MAVVVSWASPSHFWTSLSEMPAETAATPKPYQNPLAEEYGPSSRAPIMTSCTARQPVIRLQDPSGNHGHVLDGLAARGRRAPVECLEQGRGNGNAALDTTLSLLKTVEGEHAGG